MYCETWNCRCSCIGSVSVSSCRYLCLGCVAMGTALLCIWRSRLLVYSAGSVVNRVQVVLSGFSIRLFFVLSRQKLYVGMVVYVSWLNLCECDGDVICVGHDLNRCTGWW